MISNIIKTTVLLLTLNAILLFLGSILGGTHGIFIGLFIGCTINGIAFFFSDKIVLSLYKAQPLPQEQYHAIYQTVEELTAAMHIPMPQLWIISTPIANAFATGRSPKHASIALTKTIITLLDHDELRGVLAHELAHIKNRDTLICTIAAIMCSAIGYLAYMIRSASFWGYSGNNKRQTNPMVLFIIGLLVPFFATLIQLALSRSREYAADYTGACCGKNPLALALALEKIHSHSQSSQNVEQDAAYSYVAPLFIINPLTTEKSWTTLFATHPPIHERIKRLHALSEKLFS